MLPIFPMPPTASCLPSGRERQRPDAADRVEPLHLVPGVHHRGFAPRRVPCRSPRPRRRRARPCRRWRAACRRPRTRPRRASRRSGAASSPCARAVRGRACRSPRPTACRPCRRRRWRRACRPATAITLRIHFAWASIVRIDFAGRRCRTSQLAVVAAGDERRAGEGDAGDVALVGVQFLRLELGGGEVGLVDLEVGAAEVRRRRCSASRATANVMTGRRVVLDQLERVGAGAGMSSRGMVRW